MRCGYFIFNSIGPMSGLRSQSAFLGPQAPEGPVNVKSRTAMLVIIMDPPGKLERSPAFGIRHAFSFG